MSVRRAGGLTVHQIRRLHVCAECGGIGFDTADLATQTGADLVVRHPAPHGDGRQFAHPRCIPIATLLQLDPASLGEIRMGDVTPRALQMLLAKIESRGRS
jgi:hypothetical protein